MFKEPLSEKIQAPFESLALAHTMADYTRTITYVNEVRYDSPSALSIPAWDALYSMTSARRGSGFFALIGSLTYGRFNEFAEEKVLSMIHTFSDLVSFGFMIQHFPDWVCRDNWHRKKSWKDLFQSIARRLMRESEYEPLFETPWRINRTIYQQSDWMNIASAILSRALRTVLDGPNNPNYNASIKLVQSVRYVCYNTVVGYDPDRAHMDDLMQAGLVDAYSFRNEERSIHNGTWPNAWNRYLASREKILSGRTWVIIVKRSMYHSAGFLDYFVLPHCCEESHQNQWTTDRTFEYPPWVPDRVVMFNAGTSDIQSICERLLELKFGGTIYVSSGHSVNFMDYRTSPVKVAFSLSNRYMAESIAEIEKTRCLLQTLTELPRSIQG